MFPSAYTEIQQRLVDRASRQRRCRCRLHTESVEARGQATAAESAAATEER